MPASKKARTVKPTREESRAATEAQAPTGRRNRPTADEAKAGNSYLNRRVVQLSSLGNREDTPSVNLTDMTGEAFFIKTMRIVNTKDFGESYAINILHLEYNKKTRKQDETAKTLWASPDDSRDELAEAVKAARKGGAEIIGPFTIELVGRYRRIRPIESEEFDQFDIVPF